MDCTIDVKRMDRLGFERFLRATLEELRRVQKERPALWQAAIERAERTQAAGAASEYTTKKGEQQ